MNTPRVLRSRWFSLIAVLGLSLALSRPALAERPAAEDLLPKTTIALIHVPSVPDLKEKFLDASVGRMLRDEKLKPLLQHLYGSASTAFKEIEERVGVPLDKLLEIPQGEIIAAITIPDENTDPAAIVILDAGDRLDAAQILLDKARGLLEKEARLKPETETVGETKITWYKIPEGLKTCLALFHKDKSVVFCTNLDVAKELLARWDGKAETKPADAKDDKAAADKTADSKTGTLAQNPKFSAIMKRCRVRNQTPQIVLFADPIELVKGSLSAPGRRGGGSFTMAAAMAFIPTTGLDGLQGVGGAMTFGGGEFEAVSHFHILIENPRRGIMQMIALGSGDVTPQRWVPDDVANYSTMYWDFERTYREIEKLVDSFQGDKALANMIKSNFNKETGIDFHKEILPAAKGRVTYVTWISRPVTLTSQSQLFAVELTDPKATAAVVDRVGEKFKKQMSKETSGDVTYYKISVPEGRPGRRGGLNIEPPTPCFAVVGNTFMFTDRENFMKKIIASHAGGAKSLADRPEYKLVASRIQRLAGGAKPGAITFDRPEESIRYFYELASDKEVRAFFKSEGERNPFFRALDKALEENPLPPYEAVSQYLAPSGAVLTNDETGFHYTTFGLKRK